MFKKKTQGNQHVKKEQMTISSQDCNKQAHEKQQKHITSRAGRTVFVIIASGVQVQYVARHA